MPVPHQLNLTPQSRVAMLAVGKLAVEAGEQRRIFGERESRAGIDLQCVVPRARRQEQRTRNRHKQAGDRAVGIELMSTRQRSASCSAKSLTLVAIASETSPAEPSSALSARTRIGRSYWPCRRYSTMIPASASAGSVSTYARPDHVRVAVSSQFR